MNAVLLKALMDQNTKEAQRLDSLKKVRSLQAEYNQGVKDAYGIENIEELGNPWSYDRIAQVMTSRAKDLAGIDPKVSAGRAAISERKMQPLFIQLLRNQGVRDAFQGAREAEMQLPTFSDPRSVVGFFNSLEELLGGTATPFSAPRNKKQVQKQEGATTTEYDELLKKYGYK